MNEKLGINKNGIPVGLTPKPGRRCVNKGTGHAKEVFYLRASAERWIAENIHEPERRSHFEVYECAQGHFHLATRRRED